MALLVGGVEIPLEDIPSDSMSVVVDTNMTLLPRMAVSGKGRLVMDGKLEL